MATMTFDPQALVAARVLNAWPGKTKDGRGDRCGLKLAVTDNEGKEWELKASAGPMFAYLIPHLEQMAQDPGTAYNVHLQQDGDFLNVVGIDGVAKPAGWDEKMRAVYGGGKDGAAGQASRKDPITIRMHAQVIAAKLYPMSGPQCAAILSGNWAGWDAMVDHLVGQVYGTKPKGIAKDPGPATHPAAAPAGDEL